MKFSATAAKKLVDLYKEPKFVRALDKESLNEESRLISDVFRYCESANIPVLVTTPQLKLINNYIDEIGDFNRAGRKNTRIFNTKLFIMNLETVLFESLRQFVEKNSSVASQAQAVEGSKILSAELENYLHTNDRVALVELLSNLNKKSSRTGGGGGGTGGTGGIKQILIDLQAHRTEVQILINKLSLDVINAIKTNKGGIDELSKKLAVIEPLMREAIVKLGEIDNIIVSEEEKTRKFMTLSEQNIKDELTKQRNESSAELAGYVDQLLGKIEAIGKGTVVPAVDLSPIEAGLEGLRGRVEKIDEKISSQTNSLDTKINSSTLKILNTIDDSVNDINGKLKFFHDELKKEIEKNAPKAGGIVVADSAAIADIKKTIADFQSKLDGIKETQDEILKVSREDNERLLDLVETYNQNIDVMKDNHKEYKKMLTSVKKRVAGILVTVAIFGATILGGTLASHLGLSKKIDDLSNKVESVLVIPSEDEKPIKATSLSIAQYIIENKMYDHENLTKFTEGDITKHNDALIELYGEEIPAYMRKEIVNHVNEFIERADAKRSTILLENGDGYTITSNKSRIDVGADIVLTVSIKDDFVFDPSRDTLQISNATYAGMDSSVDGNVITIRLTGVRANTLGSAIGFTFGDFEKKPEDEDDDEKELGSIFMNIGNEYGEFRNIDEGASLESGFSFDFAPYDIYNKTQPVFTANGEVIVSLKNADGSYSFTILPEDLTNGDVTIEDETSWEINKYSITCQAGEGFEFYKQPTSVVHGSRFSLLVKINPEYNGSPILVVKDEKGNEVEVHGTFVSGSANFFKYDISAVSSDIVISGNGLQKAADNTNTTGTDSSTSDNNN